MIHTIHALPPDTQLGNYRLLEPIGRGGFGLTYMAWDEKLERNVVIKECFPSELCVRDSSTYYIHPAAPELEADYSAALESLMNEARILASQNHEHIVRVYDVFEAFGSVFYVMPYLEGGSLLARMAQAESSGAPLPPAQVESWLCDLLSALDYLHERQLYHRDIKPSNILFDEQNRPVLIDFGAALNMPDVMKTITQGVFTIAYAAPEQITGKGQIGPWTDYYALAATWYRLIAGKCIERADARLMQDDTHPLSSMPQSKEFSPLLIKAIELNLSLAITQRFQSPADWAKLMKGKMPSLPKSSRRTSSKTWMIVGGVALVAILGLLMKQQEKAQPKAEPAQQSAFSPFAAQVSTSRLDQLKEDVDDLAYELQCLEANYYTDMFDYQNSYTMELHDALVDKKAFFEFDFSLLDQRYEKAYQDWETVSAKGAKLRQEWQQEMARLTGLKDELRGEDQQFFAQTLAQYKKVWETKYSAKLSPDTPPAFLEKIHTETRQKIEESATKLKEKYPATADKGDNDSHAVDFDKSQLEQIDQAMQKLKTEWPEFLKEYAAALLDLEKRYLVRIKEEMRQSDPILNFNYALLIKEKEKAYQKWTSACIDASYYRRLWKEEIARLANASSQLNEQDQHAYLISLSSYNNAWEMKNSSDFTTNIQTQPVDKLLKESWKRLNQYIEEHSNVSNSSKDEQYIGADIGRLNRLKNLEYLK